MHYTITTERCTGCGACTDICPTEAITIEQGKVAIGPECIDCGSCPRVCPEGAIKMQKSSAPLSTAK